MDFHIAIDLISTQR